jgi:hypothetical protein
MFARRILVLSVIPLVGLMILAAACQTTSDDNAQIVEDNPLVGLWIQTIKSNDLFIQFKADGSFYVSHLINDLEKFPAISGTYSYEDSVLTLNVPPASPTPLRCSGETASYIVKLDQSGEVILTDLIAECYDFNLLSSEENPWEAYNQ